MTHLRAELKHAQAENDRWRSAYGPFDECLINLSMLLIESDDFTDSNQTEPEEGTEEDYHAVCQNVLNAVRALIIRSQSAHTVGFAAGIEAAAAHLDNQDKCDGYVETPAAMLIDAIRALTPPDITAAAAGISQETFWTNCCECGRIVDMREVKDGGDSFGCKLTRGDWVCSSECYDRALAEAKP